MCLAQVVMVMVDLSYGWCSAFFVKKLVDFDKEIVVPSVLIIAGTIGIIPSHGRTGVP